MLSFVALGAVALVAPASASAINPVSFSPTGSMSIKRDYPGAAPLADGRILVVGGYDGTNPLDTAEIFNPQTNSFSSVGATMATKRYAPAVAKLPDGRVLVAGGWDGADVASAEVFNPSTNSFSPVGSLAIPLEEAMAAPLPDGRVLVAAGYSDATGNSAVTSSEIFNPQTNSFSPGPSLPRPVYGGAAAVISGGKVLVAGGIDDTGIDLLFLNSAFVFNPSSNSFSTVASLAIPRYGPAGASLPQGRALMAGGDGGPDFGNYLASAEIFDPSTNAFGSNGVGSLGTKRREAAGAALADGRALVVGGRNATDDALASAEVLSVPSNAFKAKLNGRTITFKVSNEGVASAADSSTKVATTAKKKKKPKLVKTTKKHGGPGKIKVKVKLTKAGSAKLAEKGKLTIKAIYTPDGGLAAVKKLKLRA